LSILEKSKDNCIYFGGQAMKKKVFISGPIIGMEKRQEYRQKITEISHKAGFDVIDPWNREKILYKGDERCWWDKVPTFDFIQRDLDDADRCDIMVVYLPVLSAGACMELFYAKRKGKEVIVVSEIGCLSPWIIAHSDKVLKSFDGLEAALGKMQSRSTREPDVSAPEPVVTEDKKFRCPLDQEVYDSRSDYEHHCRGKHPQSKDI
jgi:nucleoside 2-deoxyribosyltransferase